MENYSDFEIIDDGDEKLDDMSDMYYGDFNLTLNFKDILALLDGKVLTADINCEYAIYLRINKDEKEFVNKIRKELGKENI